MVRIAAVVMCLIGSALQADEIQTTLGAADQSTSDYLEWYRAGPVIDWSPADEAWMIAQHLGTQDFPDDTFRAGWIDLNGDGNLEVLIEALPGPDLCGSGGCMLYIYEVLDDGTWQQVFRKVQREFVFLADQSNGVWDLAIHSGGSFPAGLRVFRFEGFTYFID